MFKDKHTCRKPDLLRLLVLLASLAALMASTTAAADPVHNTMKLTDLGNGDLVVAPVGRNGAGLHLSYKTKAYRYEASRASGTTTVRSKSLVPSPTLFLSLQIPW